MKKTFIITLVLIVFVCTGSSGQGAGFLQQDYGAPFAGGMNAIQFGKIDLDRDGTMDLLAFDRYGNRLMPYINSGAPGMIDYRYAPEYIPEFPELIHWVILADYNMDGKQDLFTYNPVFPGIMVYKNTSANALRFERVVYPYLTSWYGSGYVNILVTYADYPGISDLDGDGDLDILTFWALGSFVEMHQNLSMEQYGHADSLIFERTTWCWGEFAESEESNILYLDTCFGGGELGPSSRKERHTGSTLLLTDINNNGNKDLLLGDVDYPQLIYLANEGTPEQAYIGSYNQQFPAATTHSWIYSMPAAALIDVNNDGADDLLVSPFDPNPFVTQNHQSVWLYTNSGSNEMPEWVLSNKRFLQDDMIDCGSGAYPVLADLNLDGLQDLVIGNWGYYASSWYDDYMTLHSEYTGAIALFMNRGTETQPYFDFETDDFGLIRNMDILGPAPALGDIDTDDDPDMIVGRDDGTLLFYRNCSCLGNPEDFVLETENYQGIDVGEYSTPFIFDLDEDGLLDLVIGEKAGNINFYKNTGDIYDPVFTLVTDSLGKINVTDPALSYNGYSTPYLFRGRDGNIRLISGSEQGTTHFYGGIEGNLLGAFTLSDELWKEIDSSSFDILSAYRTAAALADLNADGWLDMMYGNFSGGLNLYSNAMHPGVSMDLAEYRRQGNTGKMLIYPNPASGSFRIKAGLDPRKAYQLEIMSISGISVARADFTAESTPVMHIETLPEGVYICILKEKGAPVHLATGKLLIHR